MYVMDRLKQQLIENIKAAVLQSQLVDAADLPNIILETPKEKEHGDFSTNIAMQLTRVAKRNPREIAAMILEYFDAEHASISKTDIAGPGFINFHIDKSVLFGVIPQVLSAGDDYGRVDLGAGKKIQVEFVSANPTGALHLGHARGAAVGDALCHILSFAGYQVSREYYINDAGNQIDMLARSIEARYLQALGQEANMPEDGYHGDDIVSFGQALAADEGDRLTHLPPDERHAFFTAYGLRKQLDNIKQDLARFGVFFDEWFSESSLYEGEQINRVLQELADKKETYEADDALWLRTTTYGDDKDRVLIKKDGSYTYLTPDIAYHQNKFSRGFDQLINIWGADHHGYIPRMKAAMQALGYDAERLVVLIAQMVSLYQNGERVRMSKRTGKAVTMAELMDEVGVDAIRYFFTMRSMDAHLDFDMDLAVSQSNENPVYYVQYAHARICSVFRQAEEQGIQRLPWEEIDFSIFGSGKVEGDKDGAKGSDDANHPEQAADLADQSADLTDQATDPADQSQADQAADLAAGTATDEVDVPEADLLIKLASFNSEIEIAAELHAPHRIVRYVYELASLFHSYYRAQRVITDDAALTQARLALLAAVRTVIRNALRLIGVSAPERM